MSQWFLYGCVLAAYSPGLVFLASSSKAWQFPAICFAFLGMFTFNAFGSIGVFSDQKIYWLNFDTAEVSAELAIALSLQAVIFYAVCGPYIFLRRPEVRQPMVRRYDFAFVALCSLAIVVIAALYFRATGRFLLQESISGEMNTENALAFREQYVYGMPNWPIYNLAFVFIPVILSNHALLISLASNPRRILVPLIAFGISVVASLSLGSKGGVLNFLLTLSVTYAAYLGLRGDNPLKLFKSRAIWLLTGASVAMLLVGYSAASTIALTAVQLVQRIAYRLFVAYPETLAAAISYFHHEGAQGIAVFPTMRGTLPHVQVNLSAILHQYQANIGGGVSVPMAAEAFLVAGWASLILMLPIVFLSLIVVQEVSLRLRIGLFGVALSALGSYLAIQLSLNGMFASFYNFMYPTTVVALGGASVAITALSRVQFRGK